MSAFATPRRRQRRDGRDVLGPPALPAELRVLRGVDERLHLAGDALVVPGDLPERRVGVREREEPLVVRLGRLDISPVVAERLDLGLPDRAQILVAYRADLEAVGERMVGEIVDRGPHHLGGVGDRLVAGGADERGRGDVAIVVPGLEQLLADVVLARDLTKPALVPRKERRADPSAADVRIDEADVLVDARPVGFLIPPDAAVRRRGGRRPRRRPGRGGIAALEMLVPGGDSLDSLDALVALALRPGGDDAREVRVVGRPAKRAEGDSVDLLDLLRCVHVTPCLGYADRPLRPSGTGARADGRFEGTKLAALREERRPPGVDRTRDPHT